MQDNTHAFERPASANTRQGAMPTENHGEELRRLFRSLFENTHTAGDHASAGDFAGMHEHLKGRRRVLHQVQELVAVSGQDVFMTAKELKSELRVMLQSTQEENLRILQLIQERKKNVLSKIAEVQNRRHVLDYLR